MCPEEHQKSVAGRVPGEILVVFAVDAVCDIVGFVVDAVVAVVLTAIGSIDVADVAVADADSDAEIMEEKASDKQEREACIQE